MNRRLFLRTSAGLIASVVGHFPANASSHAPRAIAIVDPLLPESLRAAVAAAREGAHLVDCGGDVGAVWYAALARTRVPLVGALRASDFFVLRHLASSDRRAVTQTSEGMDAIAFSIVDAAQAQGERNADVELGWRLTPGQPRRRAAKLSR